MRFTWANLSERKISVSNVCVTCNGFREFYTSDRFSCVCALSVKSMKILAAQPNCRVFDESYTTGLPVLSGCSSFFKATALLSPFFLDLSLDCSSTWRCPQICNHSWSCRTSILEGATFHSSSIGTSSSGTSGFRRFRVILLHERIRRRIRLYQFLHAYWYRV